MVVPVAAGRSKYYKVTCKYVVRPLLPCSFHLLWMTNHHRRRNRSFFITTSKLISIVLSSFTLCFCISSLLWRVHKYKSSLNDVCTWTRRSASHSHAFGGSEVINLSQHRKEGWTRHILDHRGRGYVLLVSRPWPRHSSNRSWLWAERFTTRALELEQVASCWISDLQNCSIAELQNCTTTRMHCLHHKLQTSTNLLPLTGQLSAGDNSGAGRWSSCRDY